MVKKPTAWEPLFKVNTIDSTANGEDQESPVVTGLANGNFLVVWQSNAVDSAGDTIDIKGQIFDFLGNAVGSEFRLNNNFFNDDQFSPEITATADGGFVVVYQDDVGGAGTFDILADRYDANGSQTAFATTIATTTDEETAPVVTAFSDGSYLVAYEDDGSGTSNINGVIVSAGDVVGSEFTIGIDADDETTPTVDTLSNNSVVVAYLDPNAGDTNDVRVVFEVYNSSGTLIVGERAVTTNGAINREPHVAALVGGGFVLTWRDPVIDGNSDGIAAAIFDNDGNVVLAPFQVNNNTGGSQNEPSVTALEDGGFVIIWDDDNSNIIRGQRFDAAGNEIGNQIAISKDLEFSLDAASLSDGRFITVFENNDAGNSDIYAQIWDPRETTISGTSGDDAIAGRVEASTISGGAGNDTIQGNAGRDSINGGSGNDVIDGGLNNDTLLGGTGMDEIRGDTGADYLDGGGSHDTLYGGSGNDTLLGDVGNDELRGEAGSDWLNGGGGFDLLVGLDGNDTLDGGISNDTVFGGDGNDSIIGGNGEDSLSGQSDNDTITGGRSADTLIGSAGNDFLQGDGSADSMSGGNGFDTLNGGIGPDNILGGGDDDTLSGENGQDTLVGGLGNDLVIGGAASDLVQGSGGNDTLFGGFGGSGNGNDTLIGGSGNDYLSGDNQDDTLTGNSGDDRFFFKIGDDNDVITDFVAGGTDDEIQLDNFGSNFDTFSEVLGAATQFGGDTVIDFGNGDTITLQGVDRDDLTAADFIFT